MRCLCVNCGKSKDEFNKEQERALNKFQLLAKIGETAILERRASSAAEKAGSRAIQSGYSYVQADIADSLWAKHSDILYELNDLVKIYEKEYPSETPI